MTEISMAVTSLENALTDAAAAAIEVPGAKETLAAFDAEWGQHYPAAIQLWRNAAWEEFIPFLDYDNEIRKVICSTNATESLNARYRRAIGVRGHFPTEQAALNAYTWSPDRSPDRDWSEAMDDAPETSTERLRDHLRRPHTGQRQQLTEDATRAARMARSSLVRVFVRYSTELRSRGHQRS